MDEIVILLQAKDNKREIISQGNKAEDTWRGQKTVRFPFICMLPQHKSFSRPSLLSAVWHWLSPCWGCWKGNSRRDAQSCSISSILHSAPHVPHPDTHLIWENHQTFCCSQQEPHGWAQGLRIPHHCQVGVARGPAYTHTAALTPHRLNRDFSGMPSGVGPARKVLRWPDFPAPPPLLMVPLKRLFLKNGSQAPDSKSNCMKQEAFSTSHPTQIVSILIPNLLDKVFKSCCFYCNMSIKKIAPLSELGSHGIIIQQHKPSWKTLLRITVPLGMSTALFIKTI